MHIFTIITPATADKIIEYAKTLLNKNMCVQMKVQILLIVQVLLGMYIKI